jgi:hypothetical protein
MKEVASSEEKIKERKNGEYEMLVEGKIASQCQGSCRHISLEEAMWIIATKVGRGKCPFCKLSSLIL